MSTSKTSKDGSKKGSTSPKLPSYRGMADNCRFEGETVRHFYAGKLAVFEMRAPNCRKDDIQVNIISEFYVLSQGAGEGVDLGQKMPNSET